MASTTIVGGKGSQHIDSTPSVGTSVFSTVDHLEIRDFGTNELFILSVSVNGSVVGFRMSKNDLTGFITALQAA